MFAKHGSLAGSLVLAALLAGCASSVPLNNGPAKIESRTPQTVNGDANGNATPQSQVTSVDLGAGKNQAADNVPRVVYFDYDSYTVRDDARPVIEANAKRLMANHAIHETVEGHTDERGGTEYNLALGQKRAEAVVKSLQLLGVPADQMEAVSYGKERPADPGHDEAAWAKNRRAELKDR
jgi:peptidoglycan-associated lipoprotein